MRQKAWLVSIDSSKKKSDPTEVSECGTVHISNRRGLKRTGWEQYVAKTNIYCTLLINYKYYENYLYVRNCPLFFRNTQTKMRKNEVIQQKQSTKST